ncbi:peptidyl-prolyl cis-trans isomerase, putative [Plasmodium knowlesi strain H]|uniref:peptidylprolyl isomerase n=3 Tax=Plasmodium knowlesi TaxID=5850 RepID=A0A5K1VK58_PLAKH|nr:peptidyl-prolyl cis-trans isomerase, putative [Plasmodium knowlesi strain H]OTN67087.1 putative Cyclophilin [Plasmodium knowlesi]CAA9988738.1 peptidyl-prolyl cis-trans isomerase, putative [Plasmodium knowlesi strain H]SBO21688.1 peptidyl-prolyl cis-trans isomerase, putative [Plasmodium knowlesi strain H]SBO22059.1 peptidyl-prolyl cis-trans isomerase, putative [Plasmodium knowlesi strain H]VVS78212.1 peptidyl-prolyl cis-trans isomerase, putative [Plasmodium knowlesi strain H]|eukprot:XP_002259714.1 cyclophilin, putative [Plasmodium knowlesi strain H]
MIESDPGRDEEEEGRKSEAHSSDGESSDASFGPAPLEASSPHEEAAQEEEQEEEDGTSDEDAEMTAQPGPRAPGKRQSNPVTRGTKKKRINNDIYLKNLPTNKNYQVSYMHTDVVTHVLVSNKKKYIITGSANGVVKFWYKNVGSIEFVKHFKIHLNEIICLFLSEDEEVMGSLSKDKTYKQFDVSSFDMNIIIKLDFSPQTGEFVYSSLFSPSVKVAISSSEKACIYIYKPLESDVCTQVINFSSNVIEIIKYNKEYDLCVLSDNSGLIDIVDVDTFHFPKGSTHRGGKGHHARGRPNRDSQSEDDYDDNDDDGGDAPRYRKGYHLTKKQLSFSFKSETDLYELCKYKTYALCVSISPDGEFMAIMSENYFLLIYKFATMKLYRVYDESTEMYLTAQNDPLKKDLHIDSLDFGKRLFIEKEIKKHIKSKNIKLNMMIFDESNQYIIYSTFIGIKVVNFVSNQLCYIIGKNEMNLRYLSLGLYQKIISANKTRANIHESLYINDENISDCALFCTVYKKARFYVFTKKTISEQELDDRDIYNEQPSKNDLDSFFSSPIKKVEGNNRTYKSAIIYTTLGEIHIALFHKECKKTVENFSIHSTNGYYNNCIFHRVIKNFMIQTGDPLGDGTGGESIWGKEFEDEFFDHLNHSKPFMVSMANCGPNTNGSQFFITTVPCPWLDFKHTVFGKVTQGTKVVLDIEKVRTDKRDKPLEDIKILNIKMCH